MFDLDKWQEIFTTIRENKLRTFLTGFCVGWGIFMLIILLGSGKGLENGIELEMSGDALNSLRIFPGVTQKPHAGLQPGRRIRLTNDDYEDIKETVEGVEDITGRFYLSGSQVVNYKDKYGSYPIRAVHPDHKILENSRIAKGRFINESDLTNHRKVASIGIKAKEGLFGKSRAIGKSIEVNGIAFKVVGIFVEEGRDGEEEEVVYLPITTAQRTFNGKGRIHQLLLTMGEVSVEESLQIEDKIHKKLAKKHRFSTDDRGAMRISNRVEGYQEFKGVMTAIRVFIWFIASGTLLAGIIGVSNIMIIVVKERTKEIGVRKALGATPATVVSLIMQESILVTSLAGYIGLLCGVISLEIFSSGIWLEFFQSMGMMEGVSMDNMGIFYNPEVDLVVAIQATTFLVLAGALAGWVPARRAAKIRPIEALRYE